jgi:hypothetical protein
MIGAELRSSTMPGSDARRYRIPAGCIVVVIAVFCILGCGSDKKTEKSVVKKPLDGELAGEYRTPTEREYARIAYQFAKSIASGDYSTAYGLGSGHLQSRMKEQELERLEALSRREFGMPVRIYADPVVNQNSSDLAGPQSSTSGKDAVEANLGNMKAMRAVGEIPGSVRPEIRRASVRVEIERDPLTIPDFQQRTGFTPEQLTENDRVVSYLTVVIVEEFRTFGIAYYFHRWPDIWDEQLAPETRSADESQFEGSRRDSARR